MLSPLITCQCKSWVLPASIDIAILHSDLSFLELFPTMTIGLKVACPLCGLAYERVIVDGAAHWRPVTEEQPH